MCGRWQDLLDPRDPPPGFAAGVLAYTSGLLGAPLAPPACLAQQGPLLARALASSLARALASSCRASLSISLPLASSCRALACSALAYHRLRRRFQVLHREGPIAYVRTGLCTKFVGRRGKEKGRTDTGGGACWPSRCSDHDDGVGLRRCGPAEHRISGRLRPGYAGPIPRWSVPSDPSRTVTQMVGP